MSSSLVLEIKSCFDPAWFYLILLFLVKFMYWCEIADLKGIEARFRER
jgi:hypothetical protein